MLKTNSFRFPSSDGIHACYVNQWFPQEQPRGVIQLVHGISEHVERYDRFARFLAGEGFLVCGGDHLGHGRTAQSDGVFGWFAQEKGWEKVLSDVRTLRLLQGEKYPGLPYFLFGHSMGSFLTRSYLIRYPGTLSGAILSGTAQEPLPAVRLARAVTQALVKAGKGRQVSPSITLLSLVAYNHKFAPNHSSVDWISRDEAARASYLADPLCKFVPTAGMFRDIMDGLLLIGNPKNLTSMDKATPIFFLSGDRDPVGQMGKGVMKAYDLFKAAGCQDVTLKLYRDGRHEMVNELNYEQVHRDVLAWLEDRLEKV